MFPLSSSPEDLSSKFIIQESSGSFVCGSPNASYGTSTLARHVRTMWVAVIPDRQKRAKVGLRAAHTTLQLLRLCLQHSVFFTVENPSASQLWSWPPLQSFLRQCSAVRADYHMCQYAATYLKPTSVVGTLPGLLELTCT